MKLKLVNNSNLNSININNSSKTNINGVIITGCPGIDAYYICSDILGTTGNTLNKIRISLGNSTVQTTYDVLSRYFGKGGYASDESDVQKPVLLGSINISQWILESERTTIDSNLITTGNVDKLTLTTPNIAYDVEESQSNSLHFHELTPPTITEKTFDFDDYDYIYVGTGESYWYDQSILELYKTAWPTLVSKLKTWYEYLNSRDIDLTTYDIVPWIMSDRVNIIDTQISNASYILIDAAYILKPTNNLVVMGNRDSGFKGDTSGMKFENINFVSGNSYMTDGVERLYEADVTNDKFYINKSEITGASSSLSTIGNVTLFGDSDSKTMAKLYGCVLKGSNGDTLANYVPVRRKSDNYPGLYDKIGETFKTISSYYCTGAVRYLTTENNEHIVTENNEKILI